LRRITGTFREDQYTFFISGSVLLVTSDVSDENCKQNENTCFVLKDFSFPKSCRLWDNVRKYNKVGQATDDRMMHAHCMLAN